MLKINRLRVEINTMRGLYGIDESFGDGLNFIASRENTCGKSSILDAIYYCLGFEQILGGAGGIGSKVLTSAFKTSIEDNGEPQTVTESGAYLEISNGTETRTIYRNIKSESKDPGIIIFDEPAQQSIVPEDMKSFIESALEIKGPFQIITAITLNSQELINIIDGLDASSNHKIQIEGKAFKRLGKYEEEHL